MLFLPISRFSAKVGRFLRHPTKDTSTLPAKRTPGALMPASRPVDPRSPFATGRPRLHVVGSEEPLDHPGTDRRLDADPVVDVMPANAEVPILVDRRPLPIRWLARAIVLIRWFPTGWSLLCSIPSEIRQAWNKAFGPKQE